MVFNDKQLFVQHINKLRKQSKDQWYESVGTVCGKCYAIKAFGTWLQVYRVDNLRVPTVDGLNVRQYLEWLMKGVEHLSEDTK